MNFVDILYLLAARILKGRKISNWKTRCVLDDKPSYYALPTEEEFFEAAQKFTNSYFELYNVNANIIENGYFSFNSAEFSRVINILRRVGNHRI